MLDFLGGFVVSILWDVIVWLFVELVKLICWLFFKLVEVISNAICNVLSWVGITVRDMKTNQERAKRLEQEKRVNWLRRPHRDLLRPVAAPAADELLRPVLPHLQPDTAPDELLRPSDSACWLINGMKR